MPCETAANHPEFGACRRAEGGFLPSHGTIPTVLAPPEPRIRGWHWTGGWHALCLSGTYAAGVSRHESTNESARARSRVGLTMGALRVLVVDDESLIRWAVTETLTEAGHDVVQATDAATALQAVGVTLKPFDVVLLDFRLPDSDDLSVLQRILRLTPATTVVMMTAHGTAEMMADAKQLGAYDVIAKPFDVVSIPQVLVHAHQSKTH